MARSNARCRAHFLLIRFGAYRRANATFKIHRRVSRQSVCRTDDLVLSATRFAVDRLEGFAACVHTLRADRRNKRRLEVGTENHVAVLLFAARYNRCGVFRRYKTNGKATQRFRILNRSYSFGGIRNGICAITSTSTGSPAFVAGLNFHCANALFEFSSNKSSTPCTT